MEILYYLSATFLLLFMVLATYDGFYLHIWKYELFRREESIFEHKTHTIRAVLFPMILWFLFINQDEFSFWVGILLVILDLFVLAVDAYTEGESRKSIGGLPRWEYILHLFANSFHFASIALILGVRINVRNLEVNLNETIPLTQGQLIMDFIAVNIIPGAIILAVIHFLLLTSRGKQVWKSIRLRIKCC